MSTQINNLKNKLTRISKLCAMNKLSVANGMTKVMNSLQKYDQTYNADTYNNFLDFLAEYTDTGGVEDLDTAVLAEEETVVHEIRTKPGEEVYSVRALDSLLELPFSTNWVYEDITSTWIH